jgi:hypothetical protein
MFCKPPCLAKGHHPPGLLSFQRHQLVPETRQFHLVRPRAGGQISAAKPGVVGKALLLLAVWSGRSSRSML